MRTFFNFVDETNIFNSNKNAIIYAGKNYSYKKLYLGVEKLSNVIEKNCLSLNERIGIYLPNSYEFVVAFLACAKLNYTSILINWVNTPSYIDNIIHDSGLDLIITNALKENDFEIQKFDKQIYDEVSQYCFFKVPSRKCEKMNEVCSIIYTSGSTGRSKGVLITHENLIAGTCIVSNYLGITGDDRILSLLPFTFDYGLNQILTSLYMGAELYIKYPFTFFELPKLISSEKITGLAGVPSIFISLLKTNRISKYNFEKLRYITNSGAAIPTKYLQELRGVFANTQIFLMYGLTECFRCTYLDPKYYEVKVGSIGKAIPNCEVYVLNEGKQVCKTFECGELYFCGPTITKGYLNLPQDTEKLFVQICIDGTYKKAVRSGDIVYADEDGFLFFVGRKDNLIKKLGYRTNGQIIANELLTGLPTMKECCVIAVNDQMKAEPQIIAFVVGNGCLPNDELEKIILQYSNSKLPPYMKLDRVIVVDEIPLTENSKYDEKKLKELLH